MNVALFVCEVLCLMYKIEFMNSFSYVNYLQFHKDTTTNNEPTQKQEFGPSRTRTEENDCFASAQVENLSAQRKHI